jgi:hypothetical protein
MISTSLRPLAIVILSIVTVVQIACGPLPRRSDVTVAGNDPVEFQAEAGEPRTASHQDAVVWDAASFQQIAQAFVNHRSGVVVSGAGTVTRILEDDLDPPRHQRFIVRLGNGQTVLISHNIDLAPRVNSLGEDTSVAFTGQYEWNEKGGVIHWTHHDPDAKRAGGWIQYGGHVFR